MIVCKVKFWAMMLAPNPYTYFDDTNNDEGPKNSHFITRSGNVLICCYM